MKRSSDKNPKLPTFLDEGASAPAADAVEATATSVDTTEGGAEAAPFEATDTAPGAEATAEPMFEDAGAATTAADEGSGPAATRTPRDAAGKQFGRRERGIATIVLGSIVLLAGLVTTLIPGAGDTAAMSGIDPTGLLVLGTVLLAAGATWRHVLRLQTRLDEHEKQRREDADALRQNLQVLVEAHHADLDKPPAEGEELQHVLMSMQRQDEKINNLTKAIKMYGKPLMEITGQGTELAGGIAGVKALVEGGAETMRQALARVEAQVKAQAGNSKHAEQQAEAFADIHAALQKFGSRIEQLGKAPSLEPLQQQVGRLEVTIAAVAQRLEDSEVRKSLLRLEEATQKGRESVQELLRGDLVKQSTVGLQEKVEKAAKGLADGLAKLREGQLGALEGTVRDIQREVAGVATSVSQIHAAMKNGAKAAAVAAAKEATVARETPVTRDTAPKDEAPAAKERPADPQPAGKEAAETPTGTGGGYKTGTRSVGSKNVLGAIAKLKQMKG